MALVKYNNNSISAITTAGQLASGNMVLIKEQTASSSSTISFVHGSSDVVLDSTYPIYIFKFINMHPASDSVDFQFNLPIDAGSNYNVTKTTTFFRAYNFEDDSSRAVQYQTGEDLAQGTGFQSLSDRIGNDADASCSGTLHLFNPSSTTFVKHFMSRFNRMFSDPVTADDFMAGYGNTTSDVDAIQFKFSSGNIDSGTIKLFGIKDS